MKTETPLTPPMPPVTIISSLGITNIVARTISEYDVKDENGMDLSDDLYIIRSNQLDQLAWTVAERIQRATLQLVRDAKERRNRA